MHIRVEITCPCGRDGTRCHHPVSDPKGEEVFATRDDGTEIRVNRCTLWAGHLGGHETGVVPPLVGPRVVMRETLRVQSSPPDGPDIEVRLAGTCRRCGEVYELDVKPAGIGVAPTGEAEPAPAES